MIMSHKKRPMVLGEYTFLVVRRQFFFSKEGMRAFFLKAIQRCKCVNFEQTAKASVLPKQ